MAETKKLLSASSLVESPFIILTIGEYTFGTYYGKKSIVSSYGNGVRVQYPNYMRSLNVIKINGTINTYTINMEYQITLGNDPNFLEKVFSSVSNTRQIKISYGDYNTPGFIYKEEEAIIIRVTSNLDVVGSKISYIITAQSNSLALQSNKFDFVRRVEKPTNVVREMFLNNKYNLSNIFYGMKQSALSQFIPSTDRAVEIEAQHSSTSLNYLNYLVSCMLPIDNKDNVSSKYFLSIVDDIKNEYNGPYFKITEIPTSIQSGVDLDSYEIDVGYPTRNYITNFSIDNNETWSILFDYSGAIKNQDYIYRIDSNGRMKSELSPNITTSANYMKTTAQDKSWWSLVTSYPITAKLTLKGLIRPTMLMNYVKINVLFYGQKHIASGIYAITRQEDTIDRSGYRTTLSLMRVGKD